MHESIENLSKLQKQSLKIWNLTFPKLVTKSSKIFKNRKKIEKSKFKEKKQTEIFTKMWKIFKIKLVIVRIFWKLSEKNGKNELKIQEI